MSSLDTQNLITPAQTSTPSTSWTAPAWTPAQPAATGQVGLSDDQQALDAAAASEAGMGTTEVSTLSSFGLRPSEMDPAAGERMAVGLKRVQALLACEGGNEVGCDLAGPGLVSHQTYEGVNGDTSEDLVVEDGEFTLRLSTRTNANGETERVLYYQDVDGTFLSGVSAEPMEVIPQDQVPTKAAPAPDAEGLSSFLEGALLGDFAGNDTWSAVAGQTAVGLIPVVGQIADARDTLAAVRDVSEGKDGAWARLGGAAVGWVPVIGDALKGGARVGVRLGTEVVEEGTERLIKEATEEGEERLAKEAAEEGEERLAKEGVQTASNAERIAPSRQPDPNAVPRGPRTKLNPNDKDPVNIRALTRENESADTLARSGYDIEQQPSVPGPKNPDYRIEGQIFDNYAPTTKSPRNIWFTVSEKVKKEQASRIVLNLNDTEVGVDALRSQFASWPVDGLQEILVVRGDQVIPLFP